MRSARERAQALIGEGRLYGPVNLNTLTEAIEDAEARGFQAGQETMRAAAAKEIMARGGWSALADHVRKLRPVSK